MEKTLEVLERFAKLFRANKLLIVTIAAAWWGSWGWILFVDKSKECDKKELQVKAATDETIKAQKQTIDVLTQQIIKNAK